MNKITLKVLTIFVYIVSSIAIITIFIGFVNKNEEQYLSSDDFLEAVVLNIYNNIERGNYEELYKLTIEGTWEEKSVNSGKRVYGYSGIVYRDVFLEQLKKDFGSNGWRISFNSLEIRKTEEIYWEEFKDIFPKESIILKNNFSIIEDKKFYMANVKGYTIGSCSITNWEKNLPIFQDGSKWKVIVPGVPDDLRTLHREMWLVDISFNFED